jgi:hypothetical protein
MSGRGGHLQIRVDSHCPPFPRAGARCRRMIGVCLPQGLLKHRYWIVTAGHARPSADAGVGGEASRWSGGAGRGDGSGREGRHGG